MYLTANEIAKALGLSTETIRYYVREGLLSPHRNESNGYWEYSSEDLLRLTDILFYRSMSLTIPDIKAIMLDDLPLQDIQQLLERRKSALIAEIREKMDTLHELQIWSELHMEEMRSLGTYRVGTMPPAYRRRGSYDMSQHMASYLRGAFDFEKGNWMDVSLSFFYDAQEERLERYLALLGDVRLKPSNLQSDIIVEEAPRCLITEVLYNEDTVEMLRPIMEYADSHSIRLTGKFYGRENTNYFEKGKRKAVYCIYAVMA